MPASPRVYLFHLAHTGLLYLHSSVRKNYATALKDKAALDFFFRLLRPRPNGHGAAAPKHRHDSAEVDREHFRFVSPCAGELNFLHIDDPLASLVYHDISSPSSPKFDSVASEASELDSSGDAPVDSTTWLHYAGSLSEPLSARDLRIADGRLYHRVRAHRHLAGQWGLLSGRAALALTHDLEYEEPVLADAQGGSAGTGEGSEGAWLTLPEQGRVLVPGASVSDLMAMARDSSWSAAD